MLHTMENSFRRNSISTIRIIAALQVLYIHVITHFDIAIPTFITSLSKVFMGVPFFFAASGFLIWHSLEKYRYRGGYKEYLLNRFTRIYPELWVAVGIELVLIVVFVETIDWLKLGLFCVAQGTVLQFWTPDFLRGFGCGVPNGSLWTICIIIQFYLLALFMYRILHERKRWAWIAALVFTIIIKAVNPFFNEVLPEMIYKLYSVTLIPFLFFFVLGAMLAEYWNEKASALIKKLWPVFLGLTVLFIFIGKDIDSGNYGVITYSFQFFALIGFAYSFPALSAKRDISYGIYLYHMLIVNVMLELGMTDGSVWYLPLVALASCILAFGSSFIPELTKKLIKKRG